MKLIFALYHQACYNGRYQNVSVSVGQCHWHPWPMNSDLSRVHAGIVIILNRKTSMWVEDRRGPHKESDKVYLFLNNEGCPTRPGFESTDPSVREWSCAWDAGFVNAVVTSGAL
ncbi:unnamed protein product [Nesidiocoris tenuis]|uniref:Uncharacterized protein n=1 Tax=Nesidiocoris tenuis TaxID=355587 RepID=A0A6H5HAF5_9HEMI|nr:unnamed protein product [Nesidiocoris tenuis]